MSPMNSLRPVIPLLGLLASSSLPALQTDLEAVTPQAPDAAVKVPAAIAEPDLAAMQRDAEAIIAELAGNKGGEVYSGAVEGTIADDFAIAVALVDGRTLNAGRAETRFPLMSISKPFTFALAVDQRGIDFLIDKIGVSATGMPYNDVAAGAVRETTEQNPLVNAGAIATHSFVQGESPKEKIDAVVALYSALADRPLAINEDWRAQPRALTYTLAYQMKDADRLEGDVDDVTDRYLEACIVGVTVEDLARMGATLANDGIRPGSDMRVLSHETVRAVLSVMVIAGMYEQSGLWWTRVGLPAKSGVSGAILAVVPGWGSIVAYSPRLDAAGNSVRGALAIERMADKWRLHSIDRLLRD